MKKFKHWLIKKLGGCLPDRKEIQLTKTVVKPIKVSAIHEEYEFAELKRRHILFDANAHIEEILARRIAEELSLHGLLEVKQNYDEFTGKTRFVASILVIPQEKNNQ